ncbi:hypothetical protein, partial [uncultured Parasutterella sp.]|uniref:hypothetical protein n=1 Tax=uncultured Parasutterella sp. TaxID=1263098 RepID=UPI002711F114
GYLVLSGLGYDGLYSTSINAKLNCKLSTGQALTMQLNYFFAFNGGKQGLSLFRGNPITAQEGFSLP